MGVPILEAVVLVRPDVFDLERSGASLGHKVVEIGRESALRVEPVSETGQNVAHLR